MPCSNSPTRCAPGRGRGAPAPVASDNMTSAAGGRNDFGDSLAWAAFYNLNQQREARQRIEAGETQRSVARSYNVSQATISRLNP